jgi:hypothetical protein
MGTEIEMLNKIYKFLRHDAEALLTLLYTFQCHKRYYGSLIRNVCML